MSDYVSEIFAARMNAVNARLSARMKEITAKTGIQFSDMFSEQLSRSTQVSAGSDDTYDMGAGRASNSKSGTAAINTADAVASTYSRGNYDALIGVAAAKYGVSSALVRAVVWAESNFNTAAVSGSGAMGLMQLMPDVASGLGVSDAFDPWQNLDAGARLLSEKITKYNGDLRMALASYNCGETGLSGRDIHDLTDPEQFARLPGETQSYLSRIEGYLESIGLSLSGF
ncbi:MAG: lytic transglycosylase domain-containing protein [Oscillospiraceae bacterium]|nr:lytic transglycosylase domain-containing protein [Oscillospiraceae bacterium]